MTGWRDSIATALVAALVVPALAGCTLLSPAHGEASKEMLTKLPAALPQRETHAATLLVLPPETESVFDSIQMAYTIQPYQVAYYAQHEWGATPSQMLQPLLVNALENTRYFRAVLTPPYSGPYSYSLRTQILELTQDFSAEPATVHFSVRLQLGDGASGQVIATREISLREPMQYRTPRAGVDAANDAVAKALQETAGFVLENMP